MTLKNFAVTFVLGSMVLVTVGATSMRAQSHVNSPDPALGAPSVETTESHPDGLTGHAADGKKLYRRFCIGCHGPDGNGEGMNAQWIDPKPRDFTEATFKCRSTPTGTLPTDDDLYNAITRGFVTTNMPSWRPLTPQDPRQPCCVRQDLVAALGQRETRDTADYSVGDAHHHRQHPAWTTNLSATGMLEVPRSRRDMATDRPRRHLRMIRTVRFDPLTST